MSGHRWVEATAIGDSHVIQIKVTGRLDLPSTMNFATENGVVLTPNPRTSERIADYSP